MKCYFDCYSPCRWPYVEGEGGLWARVSTACHFLIAELERVWTLGEAFKLYQNISKSTFP